MLSGFNLHEVPVAECSNEVVGGLSFEERPCAPRIWHAMPGEFEDLVVPRGQEFLDLLFRTLAALADGGHDEPPLKLAVLL